MDRQSLALLIPILALAIPVLAIAFNGWQKVMQLKLKEVEARNRPPAGGDAELQALREEVDLLRQEVGELQERADFTERLLARANDAERLPRQS